MTAPEWKIVAAILAVMAITVFTYIGYYQLANVLPVFLEQHGDLNAWGFEIPIPWYLSIDPLFSILSVPLLFRLWRLQGEPSELTKIATGSFISAGANLILVTSIALSAGKVLWVWPFLYCAVQGVGFMYFWPSLLALVSRTAPAKINATMMGVAFLTLFVANNLIGWIGTFYERMTPLAFWSMHIAIPAGAGVVMLLLAPLLRRALDPR